MVDMGSAGTQLAPATQPVLCVDLDGTLIRGDLLWECVVALLKTRPAALLLFPFWLLRGRAYLKHQLARRVHLDPSRLSYTQPVLDLLRQEKLVGRRIALVTASDRRLAEAVAGFVGLFDEIHASDGEINLKGSAKANFLERALSSVGL